MAPAASGLVTDDHQHGADFPAQPPREILDAAGELLRALAAPVRALAADPVLAAVGDMVCDPLDPDYNSGNGFINKNKCQQKPVAQTIVNDGVNAFVPLGDVQYSCGSLPAFQSAYQATFGALLNKTYPVPGNHEYRTTAAVDYNAARETGCTSVKDAAGYFSYFGNARSATQMPANLPADAVNKAKGYYSYTVGSWHILSRNTNDNCSATGTILFMTGAANAEKSPRRCCVIRDSLRNVGNTRNQSWRSCSRWAVVVKTVLLFLISPLSCPWRVLIALNTTPVFRISLLTSAS
mgnify:CR=1 FL=1